MSATGISRTGTGTEAEPVGPMRADARRNRQRLLAAALDAFAEHGADDASLDEIARRAGVGIGTLYRHFPTRQALLEAVYRDQVEALCAYARELPGTRPPADALASWLRALVAFGATKRNLTISMMSTLDKSSEVVTSCSSLVREAAGSLLARAQQSGEIRPDVDATDLLKLSHAISVASDYPTTHPDQAERLLALMLDGLRAGPHEPGGGPDQ
ncbi:MAG TPA: TetR/AcrR family transcriptional regulator [Streptosporangiaceae bacterium]|nr:TetR/AcrR family transcriptional regulator [Streptosporangiaceae bacterium]